MSFALKTLEKIKESVDNLSGMVRSLIEKASEETSVDGEAKAVVEPSAEVKKEAAHERPKMRKTGINRSDLVREYFRKHGMEVKNKDIIVELEKVHSVKVEPSLVSTIRGKISKGSDKKSRKTRVAKTKARTSTKDLKGLPMPALCAEILKKSGREGLKLKDITERVIESGYEYKGNKGNLGIAQNVYQALHGLSQKKSHPGYSGKVAVIIHDEPSKRWKLNPKATKSRKIA